IIGFIGLVIPHLIRMTTGANHRWLIPCSALAGACLLLMADMLARTLVQPAEMHVGLLTRLLGGPYFLWLILSNRRITCSATSIWFIAFRGDDCMIMSR
ncbi:iron chelate uptake ABC transporter family permease subunit, partial [Escherichia coli]|uniref:iron chelate uptake ABC transporter family permease subunit n=1 Tax=Escherichia coli TaxID=562 RepID=UPI001BAE694F